MAEVNKMEMYDKKYIDSVSLDGANNLVMVVTDNLPWEEGVYTIDEKEHLLILQEKVNKCIEYINQKKHQEQYPGIDIKQAFIEIHFKYMFTEHCNRYLQLIHGQLGQYGIKVEVYRDKENV